MSGNGMGWDDQGRSDDCNREITRLVVVDVVFALVILAVLGWIWFA